MNIKLDKHWELRIKARRLHLYCVHHKCFFIEMPCDHVFSKLDAKLLTKIKFITGRDGL